MSALVRAGAIPSPLRVEGGESTAESGEPRADRGENVRFRTGFLRREVLTSLNCVNYPTHQFVNISQSGWATAGRPRNASSGVGASGKEGEMRVRPRTRLAADGRASSDPLAVWDLLCLPHLSEPALSLQPLHSGTLALSIVSNPLTSVIRTVNLV